MRLHNMKLHFRKQKTDIGGKAMRNRVTKKLFMIGLTFILTFGMSSVAYAASHIGACGATGRVVYCGSFLQNTSDGTHVLYTTNNGTKVTCNKTREMHLHTLKCAGCGATMESNVVRTCRIKHQYCPNEENVCK